MRKEDDSVSLAVVNPFVEINGTFGGVRLEVGHNLARVSQCAADIPSSSTPRKALNNFKREDAGCARKAVLAVSSNFLFEFSLNTYGTETKRSASFSHLCLLLLFRWFAVLVSDVRASKAKEARWRHLDRMGKTFIEKRASLKSNSGPIQSIHPFRRQYQQPFRQRQGWDQPPSWTLHWLAGRSWEEEDVHVASHTKLVLLRMPSFPPLLHPSTSTQLVSELA